MVTHRFPLARIAAVFSLVRLLSLPRLPVVGAGTLLNNIYRDLLADFSNDRREALERFMMTVGDDQQLLARKLEAMRLVQVALSREEVQRYYEAYCNGVLWPLFHYFASELPLEIQGFDDYERVNRRFADAVAAWGRVRGDEDQA